MRNDPTWLSDDPDLPSDHSFELQGGNRDDTDCHDLEGTREGNDTDGESDHSLGSEDDVVDGSKGA